MAEATQADSALHPAQRSCHRCNRRKVRCNKTQPCDNCSKSKSECVFPGPGRAPRRQKRPLKAELVSRLKSLEQEIRALTRDRDELAAQSSDTNSPVHETSRAESGQDVSHQRGRLLVEGTSNQYVSHEVLIGLRNKVGNSLIWRLSCAS